MSLDNIILRLEKVIVTLEAKKSPSSTIPGAIQVNNDSSTLFFFFYDVIDEAIKVLEIEKRKD